MAKTFEVKTAAKHITLTTKVTHSQVNGMYTPRVQTIAGGTVWIGYPVETEELAREIAETSAEYIVQLEKHGQLYWGN